MELVVISLSLFIVAVGALGLVAPLRFVALLRHLQTPAGLCFAAAFRIALGASLFIAAPTSRVPVLLFAIGVIGIAKAVVIPLVGVVRLRGLLDGLVARGTVFVRAWAAAGLGLGLFLMYAVSF